MLSESTKKSFEERFSLIRSLEKDCLIPKNKTFEMTMQNAKAGMLFRYSNHTYFIEQISTYQETSEDYRQMLDYQVQELTCLCLDSGDRVYFEWEYDDEIEITRTIERISFRDLTDDAGKDVNAGDLEQIVDDESSLIYKGKQFWYEDDWSAIYQRNEKGSKKEPVYFYEFEQEAPPLYLTIEEWSERSSNERANSDYQIFISEPVKSGEITFIAKGAK